MAKQTVFYSWQSWTDGGANRNFIQDCLERAIKEIRKDDTLTLDPVIDRDTQGVPGAADIANTIFGKVAEADVFVADVSFVQDATAVRRTPNPNVLIELGFALSKLEHGKVVCVLNQATGRVEDLPFDIRGRSVVTYDLMSKSSMSDENEWLSLRESQRKQLVGKLKHSLIEILSATDPLINTFVNEMFTHLIRAIIFGSEIDGRKIKPGCDVMRAELEDVAQIVRAMACKEEAHRMDISERLDEIALAIEQGIDLSRNLFRGNYDEYVGSVKRAVELAASLKNEWFSHCPLDTGNLIALHKRLYEMRRELDVLVSRLPDFFRRPGGLYEAQDIANSLGFNLCRFGQYDLDAIHPGVSDQLTEIGRNLHLVGVSSQYVKGTSRDRQLTAENLPKFAASFGKFVDSLPKPR